MNNTAALWFFESVNLYQTLCPHKVKTMAGKHVYHFYKKDQFIYFPEETAQDIFMIVNGRVRIGRYLEDGKVVINAILSTGEIFGPTQGPPTKTATMRSTARPNAIAR